jgi:N12 class adenine-specific DNA methylase
VVTHPGSARTARAARRLNARRLNSPRPALVEAHADGTPRRINRQSVGTVREEWRVVDRWWTEEPVHRQYFDVVLETGENAVVYRDDDAGSWFTQRA